MLTITRQIPWLMFASFLVLGFEFFSLSGFTLPPAIALPFFTGVILLVGHDTLWKGLKALLNLNFRSINLLMFIAACGAFYIGRYVEASVVIVLFNLSERLEDIGIAQSKSSLDRLVEKMPKRVAIKGREGLVDLSDVAVGDILAVRPGEMIGVDGVVTDGASFVDESPITGESLPVDKRPGDTVFAGSMNKQGALEMKVSQIARNSTVAKIRELTFEAMEHKAETQKFIEKFSKYYTPGILALAIGWTLFQRFWSSSPFDNALYDALSLLVIGCPCALVISTPISIFSAIGNASSKGILVKGGRYMEEIAGIKAMALDKTRTLTHGEPVVTDVIPFGNHSREVVLSCAAGIEQLSEHPLAQSIVNAAKEEEAVPHEVENFVSILGKGAKADCLVCYDKHHCIGKLEFILEEHHVPAEIISQIDKLQSEGKNVIVISTRHEIEGLIAVQDAIRNESSALINDLKALGIHAVMLTGDHPIAARAVARKIGIGEVMSEMLPEDKLKAVAGLKEAYGSVAMVGDGVNDAPALAMANVGISMSSLGSDAALEASSVVILNDHLAMIPYLVRLGKKTINIIKANIAFALVFKFLVIALALKGIANLALAVFSDVGVTILVILNSLRLMQYDQSE